jgi:hypothetical protein
MPVTYTFKISSEPAAASSNVIGVEPVNAVEDPLLIFVIVPEFATIVPAAGLTVSWPVVVPLPL